MSVPRPLLLLLCAGWSACADPAVVGDGRLDAGLDLGGPAPMDTGADPDLGWDAGVQEVGDAGASELGVLDIGAGDGGPAVLDPRDGVWTSTEGPQSTYAHLLGSVRTSSGTQGFAYARASGSNVYGIHRWDDAGARWLDSSVDVPLPEYPRAMVGLGGRIYLASPPHLLESLDGGASFRTLRTDLVGLDELGVFQGDLYLLTNRGTLSRSDDGGRTLTEVATGIGTMAASEGALIYQDLGTRALFGQRSGESVRDLPSIPRAAAFRRIRWIGRTAIGFSSGDLYVSVDEGDSWSEPIAVGSTRSVIGSDVVAHGPDILVLNTEGHVSNLQLAPLGLTPSGVADVARHATQHLPTLMSTGAELFVDDVSGSLRRLQGGTQWALTPMGSSGRLVLSEHDGRLYAASPGTDGLFVLEDGSWSVRAGPPGRIARLFELAGELWIAGADGQLHRSAASTPIAVAPSGAGQASLSGDQVSFGAELFNRYIIGRRGGTLGATDSHGTDSRRPEGGGLFFSDDLGHNFDDVSSHLPHRYRSSIDAGVGALDFVELDDGRWLLAAEHGLLTSYRYSLLVSSDLGETWLPLGDDLPGYPEQLKVVGEQVFLRIRNRGHLYAGPLGGPYLPLQLLATTDGWVHHMVSTPSALLVATTEGVLRLEPGRSPVPLGQGLEALEVVQLALGSALHAAVAGKGVFTLSPE